MGCGGSRADAIEPRYHESWTKETESTWLTGTESEVPLSAIPTAPTTGSLDAASRTDSGDAGSVNLVSAGLFDDRLAYLAQAYVTVSPSKDADDAAATRALPLEGKEAPRPETPSPDAGLAGPRRPSEAPRETAGAAGGSTVAGGSPERPSVNVEFFPAKTTHGQRAGTDTEITTLEKKSIICTEETKWQANRMSTKQVTITITKSIRQIGKSGRKPDANGNLHVPDK